jgi:hypothetical protein
MASAWGLWHHFDVGNNLETIVSEGRSDAFGAGAIVDERYDVEEGVRRRDGDGVVSKNWIEASQYRVRASVDGLGPRSAS